MNTFKPNSAEIQNRYKIIVDFVRDNPGSTAFDIAEYLRYQNVKCQLTQLSRILINLCCRNQIRSVGLVQTQYYPTDN